MRNRGWLIQNEFLPFQGVSISRSVKVAMERFGVLIPEKRTSLSGPLSCVQKVFAWAADQYPINIH